MDSLVKKAGSQIDTNRKSSAKKLDKLDQGKPQIGRMKQEREEKERAAQRKADFMHRMELAFTKWILKRINEEFYEHKVAKQQLEDKIQYREQVHQQKEEARAAKKRENEELGIDDSDFESSFSVTLKGSTGNNKGSFAGPNLDTFTGKNAQKRAQNNELQSWLKNTDVIHHGHTLAPSALRELATGLTTTA